MSRLLFHILALCVVLAGTSGAQERFVTYIVHLKPGRPATVSGSIRTMEASMLSAGYRPSNGLARSQQVASCKRTTSENARELTKCLEAQAGRHGGYSVLWLVDGVRVVCGPDLAQELQSRPDVASVVADPFLSIAMPAPAAPPAPASAGSWQLETSRINSAREKLGLTGNGVTVGLIDTGVVDDGPLKGRIAAYRDFTSNPSPTPTDPQGHGTAVASVLAGAATDRGAGAAPGCRLVVARVLEELELPGPDAQKRKVVGAFASRIVQAMQWMLDPDGNPDTDDAPRIVNNSWGFSDPKILSTDFFKPAVDEWTRAGILAVFSAGNMVDESTKHTFYPASYPQVLAVGSIGIDNSLSAFSATGDPSASPMKPDLTAPGDSVLAWNARDGYTACDGTSFSAPQVAGAAALLLEAWPELTRQELFDLLTATAHDLGPAGRDTSYGAGLLQAEDAARRLLAGQTERMLALKTPEEFAVQLEKLMARQDLAFVAELASDAATRFVMTLSPAAQAKLKSLPGTPAGKRFLLAKLSDLQAAGRLAMK